MSRYRLLQQKRDGSVLVVTVLLIFVIIAFSALVVDLGYLHNAKIELQRSADAAAVAACWELGEQYASGETGNTVFSAATGEAIKFALENETCNQGSNLGSSDVLFGTITDFTDRYAALDGSNPSAFNAVEVKIRRNADINGQIPFFFAKIWGLRGGNLEATATAGIVRDIRGFETPGDGSNLEILPFALDEPTWLDLLAGNASDGWSWNAQGKTVSQGADGVKEVNLYPQDTGAPGNRGTVDIGGSNNSTNDIARQILTGISPSDMDAIGGSLEFDANGELTLNGDTGISAGVKDELASIVGKTRIIPIFRKVQGPGNNADYTIVRFAGVRIMAVKLTGSKKSKYLMIQPAPIVSKGVIPGDGTSGTSDYVYSRATLIR